MVRKIASIALTIVGIAVFVAATVSLISTRLSLPPYSVETEGRWTAYGLDQWAYWIGELPLSLILLLTGVLLWPPRPHSLVTKGQGLLLLVIALVGLAVLARTAYSLVSSWWGVEFNLSLREVLLAIALYFVPMLAITILGAIGAWRRLTISEIAKKPYEAA
ncbi:MAG: hypothetical protein ONB44_09260 [candidate division KSB1 bacterium]|nr:hypothetical protein [candidate division KSB1 bacterium]MDZ7311171.1 hypothetical protein [candidate division KSB1 bacterium]